MRMSRLLRGTRVTRKCDGANLPAERFELPTNGLQNRCSTTELSRHRESAEQRGGNPLANAFYHGKLERRSGASLRALEAVALRRTAKLAPFSGRAPVIDQAQVLDENLESR